MNGVKGQSLVEILVSVAIGVIMVGVAALAVVVILRVNQENKSYQTAAALSQETLDNAGILSEADWRNVYDLSPKGSSSYYYIAASGTALRINPGTATTGVDNVVYTRYFTVENVNRVSCGVDAATSTATTSCSGTWPAPTAEIAEDPSTQKVTAYALWTVGGTTRSVSVAQYLTRWRNYSLRQTDWSGGSGNPGPTTSVPTGYDTSSDVAATTTLTLSAPSGASSGSLTSTIYDTSSLAVASTTLNSLSWLGVYPSGTTVKFQLASSNNSGGSWNYFGPDGTVNTFYQPTDQNLPVKINPRYHSGYRYFRYKAFLESSGDNRQEVRDVIINWSP